MTRVANFMVGVSLKTRVTERESDVLGKHGKQMVRLFTPEKKTYKTSVEGPCHRRRVEAVSLHQSALPTHEQSLSLTESIPPTHTALSGGDFVGYIEPNDEIGQRPAVLSLPSLVTISWIVQRGLNGQVIGWSSHPTFHPSRPASTPGRPRECGGAWQRPRRKDILVLVCSASQCRTSLR